MPTRWLSALKYNGAGSGRLPVADRTRAAVSGRRTARTGQGRRVVSGQCVARTGQGRRQAGSAQQAGLGQDKDSAPQERGLWGSTNILLAGKQGNKLLREEGKGRERSGRRLLKRIFVSRTVSLHIPSPAQRHSIFHPPAFQSASRVQAQLARAVTVAPI